MKALWGASLHIRMQLKEPVVETYAPYRQAVAFQQDKDTVWFGDGTALIDKTWAAESETREHNTAMRARKVLKLERTHFHADVTAGARPYVEGHKGGYFVRVFPNTWVSTGGAKNGTVLAALQAQRFLEALK